MSIRHKFLGITLMILGTIFLLENLQLITLDFLQVWPVFVILGGVGFWLGYGMNRRYTYLIMPATILTIYGIIFFYCHISGWDKMSVLWPVLLLGPGIGFFLHYALGKKERSLLTPGIILTALSFLFIFRHVKYLEYWPVFLIIGGLIVIFRDRLPGRDRGHDRSG